MNRPDTAPAASSTDVRRAGHADNARYQPDIDKCVASVAGPGGPDYIAHLTAGIWDFSVHDPGTGLRPEDFQQAARQLSLFFSRVERSTEALDSGALIRMVVHGDRGALIHDLKVAGQSFFAATLNGKRAAVDQVDRCVSQIADEAARRIGAPSLLWGGYRKRGESGDQWFHHGDGGLPPTEYPVDPGREAGSRSVPEPSADLGRKALDLADLHFVGLYHDDRLVWRADLFDAPVLGPFFQRVTPESRRQGYNQVIRQVSMDAHRIRQLLDLTRSSRLDRLVIDVARGAIYVLPLEDREYSLVGVTLVQTQVDEADQKLTALRDTLAGAFGPGALRVRPGIAGEDYESLGAGGSPPPSAISMAVA